MVIVFVAKIHKKSETAILRFAFCDILKVFPCLETVASPRLLGVAAPFGWSRR